MKDGDVRTVKVEMVSVLLEKTR